MYAQVLNSESEMALHDKMRQLAPMHHQRGVTADMMDDMGMCLFVWMCMYMCLSDACTYMYVCMYAPPEGSQCRHDG
jgi:hypothetical protein